MTIKFACIAVTILLGCTNAYAQRQAGKKKSVQQQVPHMVEEVIKVPSAPAVSPEIQALNGQLEAMLIKYNGIKLTRIANSDDEAQPSEVALMLDANSKRALLMAEGVRIESSIEVRDGQMVMINFAEQANYFPHIVGLSELCNALAVSNSLQATDRGVRFLLGNTVLATFANAQMSGR